MHETIAFEEAIKAAVDLTDERETLIIVTADHSHTFTMGGYPKRGNDILGKLYSLFLSFVMSLWFPQKSKGVYRNHYVRLAVRRLH